MKALFLLILIPILLSSCAHVYFTEPQPKGGMRLNEVPAELHGEWYVENEGLIIEKTGATSYKTFRDSISNATDTVYDRVVLSDTFRLYQAKPFYVLNYRGSGRDWEIIVISTNKNGDIYICESRKPDIFKQDGDLKLLNAHYDLDGRDTTVHELNPDYDGEVIFKSATFSGQIQIGTLKKIARKENAILILKKDGSVISN